jgi:hypothetical protein
MSASAETVFEKELPPEVRDFAWVGSFRGIPIYQGWIDYDAQQDRFIAKRLSVLEVPCYVELRFWRGFRHGEELVSNPAPEDSNYILSQINHAARKGDYYFRAELEGGNLKLRPLYLDDL